MVQPNPITEEELRDILELPRYQPGCAAPDCYSCAANKRRELALTHLIARWEYLELSVLLTEANKTVDAALSKLDDAEEIKDTLLAIKEEEERDQTSRKEDRDQTREED